MTLDPVPVRVLGALIEKEIVTPENYPLSLNALVNACNQKSSREPVMELNEDEVRQALHLLEDAGLTSTVRDSRVAKFEHRARTVLNLRRDETAVLCLLLLRGPQTPGELRARADRLYSFDGIEAVEGTLNRLMAPPAEGEQAQRPLVAVLPRQPGSREVRYMHLLGGPVEAAALPAARMVGGEQAVHSASATERVAALEAEVALLRNAVADLEARLRNLEGAEH